MTRVGVIGRADYGGIAAQTVSVARGLGGVDAALIVDLAGHQPRGRFDDRKWRPRARERRRCGWPATDDDARWLLERCDVVYTPECPLFLDGDDPFRFVGMAGDKLLLHANPELWRPAYRCEGTRVVLPTTWEQERFPGVPVLPMPVDRKRFPYRHRDGARAFFHLGSPAMEDRAGTDLVREALPFVRSKIQLYTRGVITGYDTFGQALYAERPMTELVNNVEIIHLPPEHKHERVMPVHADVLIAPRRYAGLSLPYLEAASLGMPIIALDVPPQNEWLPEPCAVPTAGARACKMIGGRFSIWDCQPQILADRIDLFANNPDIVGKCSERMDEWAANNSWDALRSLWQRTLDLSEHMEAV